MGEQSAKLLKFTHFNVQLFWSNVGEQLKRSKRNHLGEAAIYGKQKETISLGGIV